MLWPRIDQQNGPTLTRQTVLVAEDEALIRLSIVADLEDAGFRVLEANNADEALAMLTAEPDIRILFTDVDMPPGMNGLMLAATVFEGWPPVRIIITSGLMDPSPSEMPPNSLFFSKPYDPSRVLEAVRELAAD